MIRAGEQRRCIVRSPPQPPKSARCPRLPVRCEVRASGALHANAHPRCHASRCGSCSDASAVGHTWMVFSSASSALALVAKVANSLPCDLSFCIRACVICCWFLPVRLMDFISASHDTRSTCVHSSRRVTVNARSRSHARQQ